jgi:branched-chain amino acid transport system permease protein
MWTDYFNQFLIMAIFAVSLNLLSGVAGQVSIAHAAFGAIGGFLAGYLAVKHGWGFVPTLLIAIAGGALVGALLGLPALTLGTEHLILLTLAVQTATIAIVLAIPALGGVYGLQGLPFPEVLGHSFGLPAQWTVPLLISAGVVLAICLGINQSRVGRVLRGIREDEVATKSLGKNVFAYKVGIFSLTAGMAAFAGALFVYYSGIVSPDQFGMNLSISIVVMVVVGGSGNFLGSLLGAAFVVGSTPFFEEVIKLSNDTASLVRLIAYGVVLIAVLLIRPEGLLPEGIISRRRAVSAGAGAAATVAPASPQTLVPVPTREDSGGEILVDVRSVSKTFGGIAAVDELSFTLQAGRITGLIGPNGAGKTTVFNLITGALKPDSGNVLLDGKNITGSSLNWIARAGMVRSFQDVRIFPGMTVIENVRMGALSDDEAGAQLETVGLTSQANTLTQNLSFGEQKLVALARILATGAPVLLLDEPTSGIDAAWVDRMLAVLAGIRRPDRAICIVEHNLNVVERLADHVYFMEEGKVTAEGTMEELSSETRLSEVYFGAGV